MNMSFTICSDVHLCPETPEHNASFFRWLQTLHNTHLIIAGDLFHYWWDYSEVPQEFAKLLIPFGGLRTRNVLLSLLSGNHDFALPKQLASVAFELPNGMILEHGDAADRTLGYRVLTAVLRGRVFGAFMDALRPQQGLKILRHLAGDPARPFVPNIRLIDAQRQYGLRLLQSANWVIQGHSHYLEHENHPNGELLWLGDWRHHQSYARWENGTIRLYRWCVGGPQQEIVIPVKELRAP